MPLVFPQSALPFGGLVSSESFSPFPQPRRFSSEGAGGMTEAVKPPGDPPNRRRRAIGWSTAY